MNIIKEFILSWYFVAIVIAFMFFFIFRHSLSDFFKNMRFKKTQDGFSVGSEQALVIPTGEKDKIEKVLGQVGVSDVGELDKYLKQTKSDLENRDKTIEEKENLIKALFNLVQFYEFSYINLALVFNSKFALLWFYNQGLQHSSTKDLFLLTFPLSPQIENHQIEKEAIFSALTTNNLLMLTTNGSFQVTQKGEQFLKFIKFLP